MGKIYSPSQRAAIVKVEYKTCNECEEKLHESAFSVSVSTEDGLNCYCQECDSTKKKGNVDALRPFKQALKEILYAQDGKEIQEIAKLLVDKAKKNFKYAKMLVEQIDGKPRQSIDVLATDEHSEKLVAASAELIKHLENRDKKLKKDLN